MSQPDSQISPPSMPFQSQSKPTAEFNLRRAGEAVDNAQWGGMVALKKKGDDSEESESEDEVGEKHEGEDAEKRAKKKAGKQASLKWRLAAGYSIKKIFDRRAVIFNAFIHP